jgi:predicted double-glycine peptidase
MNLEPVWEAMVALVVTLTGVGLGCGLARLRGRWWLVGYVLPLSVVLSFAAANFFPTLLSLPPFAWLIVGRNASVACGFAATMLLSAPLSRLPQRRQRMAVRALLVVIVGVAVAFFLAPLFNQRELAGLQTRVDSEGICRQGTGYTCGPAAAVTALRRLGLPAEEGPLAIRTRTSSLGGTAPDVLAAALNREYRRAGLVAEYRAFRSLEELQTAGLTLAVVRFTTLADHFVTVLEVTDGEVVFGDPLSGLTRISREAFLERWRFTGVVVSRKAAGPGTASE